MKNNQKSIIAVLILLAIGSMIVGILVGYILGVKETNGNVVIDTPEPPIVFEVDGIGCVIAEQPVLTLYTATDTVRVNIECDDDIIDYYRSAVDP